MRAHPYPLPGIDFPVPYNASGSVDWPEADPLNPFFSNGPAILSFSGGRTSGLMLFQILWAHGGCLPPDVVVCFTNTGKEREETLRFIHDCSAWWGVAIVWLERDGRHGFSVVGFNSASREGEPFAALIAEKKYLPNAVTRFCTSELKVRTMKAFALSLGWEKWSNVIGLRYDEPGRVARSVAVGATTKERWDNRVPLWEARITVRHVAAFWSAQPFDLQLLPFEGNCDACFLKARAKLYEIERNRPGTLDWWIGKEQAVTGSAAPSGARFVTEWSYAELKRAVQRQPDLFAGAFDADPEMDAECGTWCAGS